jgi:hypothetical protein
VDPKDFGMKQYRKCFVVVFVAFIVSSCEIGSKTQQEPAAYAPNEIQRFLTAVDQTLRNQIQAFSIPVVVGLTPVSITVSITPTITYRAPGTGKSTIPPVTMITNSKPTSTSTDK